MPTTYLFKDFKFTVDDKGRVTAHARVRVGPKNKKEWQTFYYKPHLANIWRMILEEWNSDLVPLARSLLTENPLVKGLVELVVPNHELLKVVLENKRIDPNGAMLVALRKREVPALQTLLKDKRCDVNYNQGEALLIAVHKGCKLCISLLLSHGADPKVENYAAIVEAWRRYGQTSRILDLLLRKINMRPYHVEDTKTHAEVITACNSVVMAR